MIMRVIGFLVKFLVKKIRADDMAWLSQVKGMARPFPVRVRLKSAARGAVHSPIPGTHHGREGLDRILDNFLP
jgi:hypothetical protein